jgi:hypothetical protein
MADMSQAKLRCGSGGDGGNAEHGAPELDTDSLHHVLLRLAECGAAKQLVACSRVCRLWYAGVLADDLWRLLLSAKCGDVNLEDGNGLTAVDYAASGELAASETTRRGKSCLRRPIECVLCLLL